MRSLNKLIILHPFYSFLYLFCAFLIDFIKKSLLLIPSFLNFSIIKSNLHLTIFVIKSMIKNCLIIFFLKQLQKNHPYHLFADEFSLTVCSQLKDHAKNKTFLLDHHSPVSVKNMLCKPFFRFYSSILLFL